jgi:hypothetical protein
VLLARLGIVVGALLLPVLLFEVLLRTAGPVLPGNYETDAWLVRHPVYGHYHPPSFRAWMKRDEFTTLIQTNEAGQRGRSVPIEKPAGTFRILVLGDSFVEAYQVAERERFIARLEDELNDGGPVRYEVIDGGCGGWGTAQEYLYWHEEGHAYTPDLVLMAFFVGNDVGDNSLELQLGGRRELALKPYLVPLRDGSLELVHPNPPPPSAGARVAEALRHRSAAYNFVESGVLQKLGQTDLQASLRTLDALERPRYQGNEVYRTRLNDRWEEGWEITEQLVDMLEDEVSAAGGRFAVVIVPTRAQVNDQAWRGIAGGDGGRRAGLDRMFPNSQLKEIADRVGVPLLDLVPPLRDADKAGGPPLYYESDQHWTAAGHAVAAQAIASFLWSRTFCPRRPTPASAGKSRGRVPTGCGHVRGLVPGGASRRGPLPRSSGCRRSRRRDRRSRRTSWRPDRPSCPPESMPPRGSTYRDDLADGDICQSGLANLHRTFTATLAGPRLTERVGS